MTKWEYLSILDSTGKDRDLNRILDKAYDTMQQLGLDGWELVSHQLIPIPDDVDVGYNLVVLLKRTLED
jgi:hypothetical protein